MNSSSIRKTDDYQQKFFYDPKSSKLSTETMIRNYVPFRSNTDNENYSNVWDQYSNHNHSNHSNHNNSSSSMNSTWESSKRSISTGWGELCCLKTCYEGVSSCYDSVGFCVTCAVSNPKTSARSTKAEKDLFKQLWLQ